MKLLALDFDGVISDSAPECFTVACATWRTLEPDSTPSQTRTRSALAWMRASAAAARGVIIPG